MSRVMGAVGLVGLTVLGGCTGAGDEVGADTAQETATATVTKTETVTSPPEEKVVASAPMSADDIRGELRELGIACDEESEILAVSNMDSTWDCEDFTNLYTWADETGMGQGLPMLILSLQSASYESETPVELVIGQTWGVFTPRPGGLAQVHEHLGGLAITLDGETDPTTLIGDIDGVAIGPEVEPTEDEPIENEPLAEEPEESGPATEVAAGIWTVGRDIAPGTYRPSEPVGEDCYWAITVSGSNGAEIIENGIPGGGFPTVTVSEGQDLELSRCGSWELQE